MQVGLLGGGYRQIRDGHQNVGLGGPFPSAVILEVVLDLILQIHETEVFW